MFKVIERLLYKLNPERAIDLKRQEALKTQKFHSLSRETRIMAARDIAEQVHQLEMRNGKMNEQAVFQFSVEKANHTVTRDERACQEVAKLVMKLYHLGMQLPDEQL